MTHDTHTHGHTTTIKKNSALRQALAHINRPTRKFIADYNARLFADYTDKARRGV